MKLGIGITCVLLALSSIGCGTAEIPQAHKGRVFEKTGALAFYAGGNGFAGPILGPGTVYTGVYNEVRDVECAEKAEKEQLTALTKDGVQFMLDIYTRYTVNCDDEKAVQAVLNKFTPGFTDKAEWRNTIYAIQLYNTMLRPALGEAVRESVSPYIANDINSKREELFDKIKANFAKNIDDSRGKDQPSLVTIKGLNLSNLDFPEALDQANTERAVQAVLKDKAIAEQDKVKAEIDTAKMKKQMAEAEGDNAAVKIDKIGSALKRNPEFLEYNLQSMMPEIYAKAGEKGNMVIAAPTPGVSTLLSAKPTPVK